MRKFRKLRLKPKIVNSEKMDLLIYHLHPSVIPEDKEWYAYLVEIMKDGREREKIRFLELAEKALTQLSRMDGNVTTFAEILRSIVEDNGIYEYEFGVFFMLYAQFQQKYGIEDTSEQAMTARKMLELIGNDSTLRKRYKRKDKYRTDALPVYIRNSIVHQGTNMDNKFTPQELKTAMEFLRKCLPHVRHKGV